MSESKSDALPLGDIPLMWGERWDSNPRHPEPQSGALPTELRPPHFLLIMERVKRIELSQPAWKAGTLPLSYTRIVYFYFLYGRSDRD